MLEDISVEGTLDGQTMQTVLRDSVDADNDGKIDALPFDHYRTGDGTEYADVLLVSSQDLESGSENLSLSATATASSGSQSQASEDISMYYAKHGENGRPFEPQTDGYRFENLTDLSYKEVLSKFLSFGVVAGASVSIYTEIVVFIGRFFGMSGTAESYFKETDKKPFSGEAYQQDESDTEIRQKNIGIPSCSIPYRRKR